MKNLLVSLIFFLLQFSISVTAQTITAVRLVDGNTTNYTCDGVDDDVQINEALDYVKEQGGTVTLSAHTFIINSSIKFAGNNTILEGAGMEQTSIKLKDNAGWCYYEDDGNGGWIYHESDPLIQNKKEAVQHLSIKNLKIDGNKYNQSLYNPITGETIQDTAESHVFDGQGHYIAVDFKKRPGSTESISDILFYHVFIYENSDDGLTVFQGNNITVDGCKGIRGGHSHVYFLNPINLVVENCDYMVTANSGIRWYDGNHIIIRNNHIYGEPEKTGNSNFCIQMTAGQSATITDDLLIEGNRLEFTSGAGIALDAKDASQATGIIIRNNIILQCGNSGTTENMREAGGINLKNITNTLIENNTIVNCIGGGVRLGGNVGFNTEWAYQTGLTAIIKNNIITNTIEGGNSTASGYGIDIASGNTALCTYNNVWGNEEGNYFGCEPDLGSISIDPEFYSLVLGTNFNNTNDTNADLHLKSEMGRWNDTTNTWQTDSVSSICINGGDPDASFSNEPSENGNRLNLGAYGNTAYASKGTKAPPVANAGPDQYIRDDDNDGIVYVTLDGSQSTDDNTITSFSWVRNGAEILTQETGTVPFVLGTVDVTLTVIDNDAISSSDKVHIKILPFGENIPPIADAGNNITVTDNDNNGTETISLDASASYDVDAIITGYSWSENGTEIGTGEIFSSDFTIGTHTVTLTVTDNEGGTNTDTCIIEVRPKADYALEFSNDFNDEVVITENLSFYSTFTLEMWIKQTDSSGDACLLWLGGDGKRVMLKTDDSYPSWDESTANTANQSISQNSWHHLAFVIEDSQLTKIYIDGVSETINELSNPIAIPTALNIGSFYGSTDAFDSNFVGIIDEIRYWNTARTAIEITENMNHELIGNEAGLEAYWNFNDGSGNRLSDISGIADGTLYNMEEVDWVTDTPLSNPVGISDYIQQQHTLHIAPNPLANYANITFSLSKPSTVKLNIFNSLNQKVTNRIYRNLDAGERTIQLDASKLVNGVYFVQLTIDKDIYRGKIIIDK